MNMDKGDFRLETERLILREFSISDAGSMFELNNDPEVIRYTGDPPFSSVEDARTLIENYSQYRQYGMGRWTVLDRKNDEYLGWCGLRYSPEKDETDLGFRFARRYWGQGFATEAAQASLSYGFERLKIPVIVGRAMKENLASIRVLEKLGMQYRGEFEFERHPGVLYILINPEL